MRIMKKSNIPFVDEIPSEWEEKPIRYLFKEVTEKNKLGKEKTALKFTYGEIIPKKDFDFDTDDYVAKTMLNYTIVNPGVVMINCLNLNFDYISQRVGLVKDKGAITSAYLAIKPCRNIIPEYANYELKMFDSVKAFHNMGTGVRKTLDFNELGKKYFFLPSIYEQKMIVGFLNHKLSEIDAISDNLYSEIDILHEYKRSYITEVVTRGLNKEVPLKDSGMSWIGMIPKHWTVDKIKYHLFRKETKNQKDKQVLSVYREYGVIPKDSRDDNHNVTSEDTSKYKYVKPNNLVINKMKAWQGSMGVSDYEGIVSPAYFIYHFRDDLILPKYLHYLFRSCYKDEFRRISGGIREGQWDLSPDLFENTMLLIPPIDEQKAIINNISSKIKEIDSIISQKQEQLEILSEYKKSLIFEYITGKKDVPAL